MEEISLYEKIVSSEIGFIIMDLNRYGGIWSCLLYTSDAADEL